MPGFPLHVSFFRFGMALRSSAASWLSPQSSSVRAVLALRSSSVRRLSLQFSFVSAVKY